MKMTSKNAELIVSNFLDAKRRYEECLEEVMYFVENEGDLSRSVETVTIQ